MAIFKNFRYRIDGKETNDKVLFVNNGWFVSEKEYLSDGIEIDIRGKRILPGFNDSHMHLSAYAESKNKCDLRTTTSISGLKAELHKYHKVSDKEVIVGFGWNDSIFEEKRMPNRHDIDEVIADLPVVLLRGCHHICVCNSKALSLLKGNLNVPIRGGSVDFDLNGEPTGVLRERAMDFALDLIPTYALTDYIDMIQKIEKDLLKVGITTVQTDDYKIIGDERSTIFVYENLIANGLKLRINLQRRVANIEEINNLLESYQNNMYPQNIYMGPIKIMGDGTLGSKTAAVTTPYLGTSNRGIKYLNDEEVFNMFECAHRKGFQVAVHAIGDATINQVLAAKEKLTSLGKDLDLRIIHYQINNLQTNLKVKEQRVKVDLQPPFIATDYNVVETYLEEGVARESYNWKQLIEEGFAGGGSDSPIEDFNPLYGIQYLVTRKDIIGNPKFGFKPEQKVELEKAIDLYTKGSSFLENKSNVKGTLSPGMLADFIVLDEDIYDVPFEQIHNLKVLQTYIGGCLVYSDEKW